MRPKPRVDPRLDATRNAFAEILAYRDWSEIPRGLRKRLASPRRVAREYATTSRAVRYWIETGQVPAILKGGRYYLDLHYVRAIKGWFKPGLAQHHRYVLIGLDGQPARHPRAGENPFLREPRPKPAYAEPVPSELERKEVPME
jgi:hypothetical protein